MDKTIAIAIVEDEPVFLQAFTSAVQREPDMRVAATATDRTGGMALLEGPPADVLLVDLGLPDGSGVDLIRRAAERWPACETMVVSMFGDHGNVMAALRAGATGYLLKDTRPETIPAQIRALRDGGSPISPVIARMLLTQLSPAAPTTEHAPPTDEDAVSLTEQERSVLSLAAKGYSYKEVAGRLDISPHTVSTYVKRCFRKLQVTSKAEAIYEARRIGLLHD